MPANNLQTVRKSLGIKQAELASMLATPVTKGTVSNHETGTRTPSVYQALEYAAVLGVTVEELFPAKPAAVRAAA